MSGGVVWHGITEVDGALEGLVDRAQAASRDAVVEAAHLAELAMKQHAGEGGRHAKATPTPATPGGGPAVISGTLRRSIRVGDIQPFGATGYSAKVGPTAIYGRRVELEYDYPYTGPGLQDVLPQLPAIYARVWGKAIAG
jgi:hypothetical protein